MTKEEILEKYIELEYNDILKAMEEYGNLMYNQGIQDAADNADADHTTIYSGIGNHIESYVIKDSILKLKKK